MIKDGPLIAKLLDWFRNYCNLDFEVSLVLSSDSSLKI